MQTRASKEPKGPDLVCLQRNRMEEVDSRCCCAGACQPQWRDCLRANNPIINQATKAKMTVGLRRGNPNRTHFLRDRRLNRIGFDRLRQRRECSLTARLSIRKPPRSLSTIASSSIGKEMPPRTKAAAGGSASRSRSANACEGKQSV